MLNGKFVATRNYDSGQFLTQWKIYNFKNGYITFDNESHNSSYYESLNDFNNRNPQMRNILIPYAEICWNHAPLENNNVPQPTRTVNVTKTNGDSVQMKFSYKDSEETVEYAVDGNGDLGDIMEMLREVVTFFGHIGFSEETSLKFMKQYVEQNEI